MEERDHLLREILDVREKDLILHLQVDLIEEEKRIQRSIIENAKDQDHDLDLMKKKDIEGEEVIQKIVIIDIDKNDTVQPSIQISR